MKRTGLEKKTKQKKNEENRQSWQTVSYAANCYIYICTDLSEFIKLFMET